MEEQLITKHNELIQASYRLTLNEMRIILYGVSLINPLLEDFPLRYEIDVKKFITLFGLENNKEIYTQIKEAAMKKLWEREFTIDTDKGEKDRFRWVTRIKYEDKRGFIKIYINPDLKPWLHQIKGYFTSYKLNKISSFQSIYSVRIYEIALMNLNKYKFNKCSFSIKITQLKTHLDLTDKYKMTSDFNRRVLEPAKKEINKYSDIRLSYTLKKQGRAFHEIKFTVTNKKPGPELITASNKLTISAPILEKAKHIVNESGTNWELQEIEKQFFAYTEKAGNPQNLEGAFIGFVKNKIKNWAA